MLDINTIKKNKKMNKTDIIKVMADKAGITQAQAKAAFEAAVTATTDALVTGEAIAVPGFGTMSVGVRHARTGKNPLTGETVNIPEKKFAKFKGGKALLEAIN